MSLVIARGILAELRSLCLFLYLSVSFFILFVPLSVSLLTHTPHHTRHTRPFHQAYLQVAGMDDGKTPHFSPGDVLALNAPRCTVCFDAYLSTAGDMAPLVLPCGHTHCRRCTRRLQPPLCPECRTRFEVPVGLLPTNYALLGVVPA